MERLEYFVRRLLLIIPTFVGITLVCLGITQFVPGGPVEQMIAQMRGLGSGEAGRGGLASASISANTAGSLSAISASTSRSTAAT
jgi:microcin C transport system permease protein